MAGKGRAGWDVQRYAERICAEATTTRLLYAVLDPGRITRKRHTLLYPNDASDSIGVCCQNALNFYWKFVLLGAEGFETSRERSANC